MTRSLLTSLLLALAGPLAAGAQQVTVSGVVVYGSPPASVGGATVRLSGSGAYFTDLDGWFRFEDVPPGPHSLTVQALGYRTRSLDLVIAADTILAVELEPDPLPLDSLLVRARTVRVRGNIVDARTGLRVLYAEVTMEPEYPTVGAISGQFTVRDVPVGQPLIILAEALEYFPARVAVTAEVDTTLTIELEPDPVAIRLLERQVERLETRSLSVPYAIDEAGREDIRMSGVAMIGELVRRRLPPGTVGNRPPYGDLPSIVYHGGGLGRPVCR
jgi:hypothetical protein